MSFSLQIVTNSGDGLGANFLPFLYSGKTALTRA
jgi:hypothetical protein